MKSWMMPLLAEAYTAYGRHTFYRQWVRSISQALVLEGDEPIVSAILHGLVKHLSSHNLWTFSVAHNPHLVSGVILSPENVAILGPSWLPYLPLGQSARWYESVTISPTRPITPQIPPGVFRHLFIAKEYLHDLQSLWDKQRRFHDELQDIQRRLIAQLPMHNQEDKILASHAFLSTLTPLGPFFLHQHVAPCHIRRTFIMSPLGADVSPLLKRVGLYAASHHHRVLFVHCGLDPSSIDHVYFPDLSWIISHNIAPHHIPARGTDEVITLTAPFIHGPKDCAQIENIYYLFAQAYHQAWEEISQMPVTSTVQDNTADIASWIETILSHPVLQSVVKNRQMTGKP
ncbi:hypothetical protein SAMN00768000_0353 [Sulfobacillus thermosulfidooxidans DSM 9293]|uniref:Uncharacterized protein n=2 Tax=Sulfobacillus thermosulfidooxidans TaxID=28034 RepID=A0A1W1W793_SULTA|nr:hypothetical protein SAMN00768000_0353 [Sulfobacillus thermosulfidooxidans DSM 9293]